jgi:hypothetical protein
VPILAIKSKCDFAKKKKKKKISKNSQQKKFNRFKGPATPADPQKEDIVDEAIKFFKVRMQTEALSTTTVNQRF